MIILYYETIDKQIDTNYPQNQVNIQIRTWILGIHFALVSDRAQNTIHKRESKTNTYTIIIGSQDVGHQLKLYIKLLSTVAKHWC
jgi:hypothetical protein